MKARPFVLLICSLPAALLAACRLVPPTTQVPMPPDTLTTVIIAEEDIPTAILVKEEETATPTPDLPATELAAFPSATATPLEPIFRPAVTPTKLAVLPSVTPPPAESDIAVCPGALPSRLQTGQSGYVSLEPPVANRVRKEPDREAEIIGQIMPGEEFTVLAGPVCADDWAWWWVRSKTQDLEGWTAEGDVGSYWLVPDLPGFIDSGTEQTTITLTADQIDGANDIEAAIINATAEGTQPGTVILDGRKGAFVFTDADRSINIFVSNLILRGVNEASIQNCGDGLFFDNFPLENILVEGIEFICEGDGAAASVSFEKVTLRNNIFRAGRVGIGFGGASRDWLITGNEIEAGWGGIEISAGEKIVIAGNKITGNSGVILLQCSGSQVENNTIRAAEQGVLLAQESWENRVQSNTIQGVSRAGIVLEGSVTGNQILDNKVTCAPGKSCLIVDASPAVAKTNTISTPAAEHLVYSNDFERPASLEWTHRHIETSPTGKKFLGQFGNDEISLNLANLADHSEIKVTFDLYIIRSWDGNMDPDTWQFEIDERSILLTTFDTQDFYADHSQAYPDDFQEGSHPPRTGAKENNTLGYEFSDRPMDTVYTLSFTVPHTSSALRLTFSASGLMADILDESWGIDNVAVYALK